MPLAGRGVYAEQSNKFPKLREKKGFGENIGFIIPHFLFINANACCFSLPFQHRRGVGRMNWVDFCFRQIPLEENKF